MNDYEIALQNIKDAFDMLHRHVYDGTFNHPYWSISKLNDLIEKEEKYVWHDLRKNPNDLPKVDGKYRCCFVENYKEVHLELEFKAEFGFGATTWIEHDELLGCPREYYFETLDEIVLGWQEIEPFDAIAVARKIAEEEFGRCMNPPE